MKQLKILTLCCIVMLCVIGCQNNGRDNTAVNVIIEGGGQFPPSLVGKWKANKDSWELTFAEDGTITKAVVAFGRWKIVPGQKTIIPMKMNKQSIIKSAIYYINDQQLLPDIFPYKAANQVLSTGAWSCSSQILATDCRHHASE